MLALRQWLGGCGPLASEGRNSGVSVFVSERELVRMSTGYFENSVIRSRAAQTGRLISTSVPQIGRPSQSLSKQSDGKILLVLRFGGALLAGSTRMVSRHIS